MISRSLRVRRSLTVVLAVFCASCSSGPTAPDDAVDASIATVADKAVNEGDAPSSTTSEEAAADVNTTEPFAEPTEPAVAEVGVATISFTNPDGTATFPSRPIFTLTSAETGESMTVPVSANGTDTLTEVEVAPGTYSISTSGPFIARNTTYAVRNFGPTEITVDGTGDAAAVVEFSVDAQSAPLELVVNRVDTSSVSLSWNGPDDATYVVRRTDGDDPATGPDDGIAVDLGDPVATAAVARGLESEADYTFALFATTAGGEALPIASATASTSKLGGTAAAFALAANTIVPTDFAALEAEQVGESMVRVTLQPDNADRASSSALPGLAAGALDGGCVVGSPFLVAPEVAGGDSFYGLIEACESSPMSGFMAGSGEGVTAIVNTDVALSHIVSYLDLDVDEAFPCSSIGEDGELVEIDDSFCAVEGEDADSDGDGLSDVQEAIWGTDPAAPDTDGDRLSDGAEVNEYGTDPLNVDSDFDRLFDEEITFFGTDPLNPDTDGDGCWDYGENAVGRNPLDSDDQGGECFEPTWQLEVEQSRAAYEAEQNGPPAADPDAAPQGFAGHALTGRSSSALTIIAAPAMRAPELQTLECESSDESPDYQVIEAAVAVKPNVTGWNKFDGIDIGDRSGPSLEWDIKASVDITLGTKFTFENKLTCALKLPRMNFPIPIAGLPFSLTVEPVVEGFASAKIVIDGPKVGVHLEANSASWISINPLWTGWCQTKTETGTINGMDVEKTFSTCPIFVNPFGTFNIPAPRLSVSAPSVTIEGELGVDIGAKITFGPGVKNSLSGFGAGIGVALIPIAGRANAGVGSDGTCAELSVGGSATAFITATAYIDVGLIKAEEGGTINLFTVDFEYPIPKYQLGECG